MSTLPTRAKAEMAAYGASAAALTYVPSMDLLPAHATAAAISGGCVWWLYRKVKTRDFRRTIRTAQRVLGPVTGGAVYAAAAIVPGHSWWEPVTALAWGGLMSAALPITRSTWTPPDTTAATYPPGFRGLVMQMWTPPKSPPAPGWRTSSRPFPPSTRTSPPTSSPRPESPCRASTSSTSPPASATPSAASPWTRSPAPARAAFASPSPPPPAAAAAALRRCGRPRWPAPAAPSPAAKSSASSSCPHAATSPPAA
ncbi:hypothetical protein STENM223S_05478 [Streptomyces tendae]